MNRRSSQQVEFVDPVVQAETNNWDEGPKRNQRGVQVSKPQSLYYLSVPFTHIVRIVFHQLVSLSLGQILLAVVEFSFDDLDDLEGVDQPEQRDKEGVEEEHDSLLLDDPVGMRVVVFVLDGFDSEGHDGGGEEQTKTVLEGEWELELRGRVSPL